MINPSSSDEDEPIYQANNQDFNISSAKGSFPNQQYSSLNRNDLRTSSLDYKIPPNRDPLDPVSLSARHKTQFHDRPPREQFQSDYQGSNRSVTYESPKIQRYNTSCNKMQQKYQSVDENRYGSHTDYRDLSNSSASLNNNNQPDNAYIDQSYNSSNSLRNSSSGQYQRNASVEPASSLSKEQFDESYDQTLPANRDPAVLEQEKIEKAEQERKNKLQIYVFVARCIAYPFYSKPPTDLVRKYLRITKVQLNQLKERFQLFLSGNSEIVGDEAFTNAIQSYYEVFLQSDRVASMVKNGGCSMHDFREVFRINIENRMKYLPTIEGLEKSNIAGAWMVKFDQICRGGVGPSAAFQKLNMPQPEMIMTKDQLYEVFQTILGVNKFEHQIIFNSLQLDNADEQAAQVRRELDGQLQAIEEIANSRRIPKMVVKDMESIYIEEIKRMINDLMIKLESVPVTKGSSSFQKFKKRGQNTIGMYSKDSNEENSEVNVNKLDIQLFFSLEIIIGQVKNLKCIPSNKMVYCTMEIEGGERLQTDHAEAGKPQWGTQGDFSTNQPLPTVKIKLYAEASGILSLDSGKELGRVIINPTCTKSRNPDWYDLQTPKNVTDKLQIQVTIRMEKPTNLKYCGFCYALGKSVFKKWLKRYMGLIQVSQYTFVMASYKKRKADPVEIMQLDGFTVDYCEMQPDLIQLGGKYFFNLVKEGDSMMFATDDESERQLWVQAIYRATGQTHKPSDPSKTAKVQAQSNDLTSQFTPVSGLKNKGAPFIDRARRHGLEDYLSAESWHHNHIQYIKILQNLTLNYRMNDPYVSLGWFSPSQMFVIDEYCARYAIRGCYRHLFYLENLLDLAEQGSLVDPSLIHFSYAFCCSHVFGNSNNTKNTTEKFSVDTNHPSQDVNKQDGDIRTVIAEERDYFYTIRTRLSALLEKQIIEFRYYFPFGRPEGALKQTLGLLERVLMKDNGQPAKPEEVRVVIKKSLDKAAHVNYERIVEYAMIEAGKTNDAPKSLADIIHLAELCIEVLRQNEEHHAESFTWFNDLLTDHAELFWSFFNDEMMSVLDTKAPDSWDTFPLFQILNDYLITDDNLRDGKFHMQLQELFGPMVLRYVDLMELSITQSIKGPAIGQSQTDQGFTDPNSKGSNSQTANSIGPANLGNVANTASMAASAAASGLGAIVSAAGAGSPSNIVSAAVTAVNNHNIDPSLLIPPVSSEDLLWKLEALQNFIKELHWPDLEFAEKLDNRLKMMAADLIDSAAKKNLECFSNWLQRAPKTTDFILPLETCAMINTIADLKSNILKLCTKDTKGGDMHQYHNQTEANLEKIQRQMAGLLNEKLSHVLENTLSKLARYDANTILSSVLSLAKPTDEFGKKYVEYMRVNLEQMRQKVTDELYILQVMETWYMTQTRIINEWLQERKSVALTQCQYTCLSIIIKKMYSDFELQGISPDALFTMAYKLITQRLQVEETANSVKMDSNSLQNKGLIGSITGSISGLSSGITKPSFLNKIG